MSKPVPAAAPVFRNARRSGESTVVMGHLESGLELALGRLGLAGLQLGGAMNRFANTLIRSAAADVAAHKIVNFDIGGRGLLAEQGNGGHDLAGLAVAALRNVYFHPGFLDRVAGV